MIAATGVKMRKASESRIGWSMVNTAHALKLAALTQTPKTR